MAEDGRHVMFDSGGYYVQLGRLRYEELYMPLLTTYRKNRWASVYTLPDHVPTSQDTPETVDLKVKDTIRFSTLFFEEMPDDLKSRAMPVVQGHTYKQVDECLRAYIRLGVKRIGFGSFGTQGQNSEINVATKSAVEIARYVIEVAHENGMKVHLFGLGTPSLVAMIKGIKADSFDSATWLKSAGFGQVFLPFMRAYNISYGISVSELQKGITFEQFNEWRSLTGHRCQLCENLSNLNAYKMHRAVHNLIVMAETVAMVNNGNGAHIQAIYRAGSPKYRGEFEKWLE
jgi:queuine/archaeosine tRNA-ribosyltransferase